ncbi:hypothetical protein BE04_37480 [Sorangium cellulosum]|uniref:Uncharacterized protein n=1 Tax=Sorangium cellulosum TaxID=56 RepID=A0A150P9D7_SORCE|nr:hypothetical protein BE04_37480 [Sorangium cellulosum]
MPSTSQARFASSQLTITAGRTPSMFGYSKTSMQKRRCWRRPSQRTSGSNRAQMSFFSSM